MTWVENRFWRSCRFQSFPKAAKSIFKVSSNDAICMCEIENFVWKVAHKTRHFAPSSSYQNLSAINMNFSGLLLIDWHSSHTLANIPHTHWFDSTSEQVAFKFECEIFMSFHSVWAPRGECFWVFMKGLLHLSRTRHRSNTIKLWNFTMMELMVLL